MLRMLLEMFGSQIEKETALNPFIARLDLPAKLPESYTYEERRKLVALLIQLNMRSKRISARIVKKICEYYGANLHGVEIFMRDSRNRKMLQVR